MNSRNPDFEKPIDSFRSSERAVARYGPTIGSPDTPCNSTKSALGAAGVHAVVRQYDHLAKRRVSLGQRGHQTGGSGLSYFIDHTLLKAETTVSSWKNCVQPLGMGLHLFASIRQTSAVALDDCEGLASVFARWSGFPEGDTPGAKAFEARDAIRAGATEGDMVLNVGALKSGITKPFKMTLSKSSMHLVLI